jgi:tetratricopeptide (TPR) repeat protein
MRAVLAILFLLALPAQSVFASCMEQVYPGDHAATLGCQLKSWEENPQNVNLRSLVQSAFYVYVTQENHPAMNRLLTLLRAGRGGLLELRKQLIQKYSFDDFEPTESSAIWAMIPQDARLLYVLSRTNPSSVSGEIEAAMKLAVYDELERFFLLGLAQNQTFGSLPQPEYVRLKVVLEEMDDSADPFIYALNRYYQGIACRNLGGEPEGSAMIAEARTILKNLLEISPERLSRKRILRSLAAANDVLENEEEAKADYYALLKIDPQDWTAIMNLSYLLNEKGECGEVSIWVEATLPPRQDFFDIVIHCGSREIPEEEFATEAPVIAMLLSDR